MEIAIALFAVTVAGVITAIVATIRALTRDGYRRTPTRQA